MTRTLTVHNAEVTTATVEVRSLTISGKQVTLAVFRQLKEQPIMGADGWGEPDGVLLGEPWGTVNYHPDRCGEDLHHLHVVWQMGEELSRSRVQAPPEYGPGRHDRFYSESADRLIRADSKWREYRDFVGDAFVPVDDGRIELQALPDYAERNPKSPEDVWFVVDGLACVANHPRGVSTAGELNALTLRRKDLFSEVRQDAADELARRRRVVDRWLELSALPQLFIAV